jgi:predicted secreted protein
MPDATERRNNFATWWGLLFAILALGCNAAFFVSLPFQRAVPRLSLFFALVALIFLVLGLTRAFRQPQVYRGKVLSIVLTVVALLPTGLSVLGFVAMHKLPSATAAPQVGQRVPDFTLADTSGKRVSLDQLVAASSQPASGLASFQSRAPKAVLLIFYRGYW